VMAAVLALGCGKGTEPDAGLSASQAQDVADVIVTDADAMLDAGQVDPNTGIAVAPSIGRSAPPPCTPVISPNPPINSDADAVPDSARFDFTGCSFSRGNYAFVLSGVIDILDPTGAGSGFGIRAIFTGFTSVRTFVPTSRTVTTEFNGIRQLTGDANGLSELITDFHTDITLPARGTISHIKNWNASFTADTPGSIQPASPLPSGILNVAGTSTWARGNDERFSLTLTTSGLHFNASCTVAPRFDAGSSTAVVTRGDQTTTVLIEHTACGQYRVTRTNT
ncbi:MAG: hypothetical protein ABI679_15450, partial [Gemmatimonadota bacterium]